MHTLFIDIASNNSTIACCNTQEVLSYTKESKRIGDHELIPLIENVLSDANIKYSDVNRIACVHGPGGFTSLRVAVACCNTLSQQLHVPVAAVHVADLYTARTTEVDYIWFHSTKKEEVFVCGFGAWKTAWPKPIHSSMQDAKDAIEESVKLSLQWTGELLDEHIQRLNLLQERQLLLDDLLTVLPAFLDAQTYKNEMIEPWYGRDW